MKHLQELLVLNEEAPNAAQSPASLFRELRRFTSNLHPIKLARTASKFMNDSKNADVFAAKFPIVSNGNFASLKIGDGEKRDGVLTLINGDGDHGGTTTIIAPVSISLENDVVTMTISDKYTFQTDIHTMDQMMDQMIHHPGTSYRAQGPGFSYNRQAFFHFNLKD